MMHRHVVAGRSIGLHPKFGIEFVPNGMRVVTTICEFQLERCYFIIRGREKHSSGLYGDVVKHTHTHTHH